ncbi:zinc transporter [Chlorella sorokiniana]|uniref:Zinc transporter n=1 Tax=Chlorella sorokiniana TaxID=3076 RepID=A0A2P6TFU8_CHLSO|nr:zinc transporter [Chlorella sorokiniana]|eukprot:PRW32991.1 zinc transporter [Chlorella sorokiniana]
MARTRGALLLLAALAALVGPHQCQTQGPALRTGGSDAQPAAQVAGDAAAGAAHGRALLQPRQLQQQPGAHAAGRDDFSVEDAILQTFAPPEVKQPRRQARQEAEQRSAQMAEAARAAQAAGAKPQARQAQQAQAQRQQGRQTLHEAAHARLLEKQRQQVVQQEQRVAALKVEQRQQASLGRGSLRSRAPQAKTPPPVTGSNPADAFAQQMERQLAAARLRRAAQQGAAAKVVAVAAEGAKLNGELGSALASGDGHQVQHLLRTPHGHQLFTGADGIAPQPPSASRIPLLWIIVMTLVMAAAAGLGAVPFFFVRSMSGETTGLATAVACGVMLAASFDLVHDGQPYGGGLTVLGVLLGGAFIRSTQQRLAAYEDIEFGALQGSAARKTALMIGIMAAHALGEGCAVGVSFCGDRGWAQGLITTLAIGVHNVPEGLAKATVLVGQGVSPRRALLWSIATCLPQPLVAIPSFMFVEAFTMILPVALGFAAGCMIWMVFAELLPDAMEQAEAAQVATAATLSAAGLEAFRMLFASMEQPDGTFGGGAPAIAAAAAGRAFVRTFPPLLVLLPAVAAAAVSGGVLGNAALPASVAWGLLAAATACSGGGAVVDQLLWRPLVPTVHTAAAAAAGACLAVLLHKQLLQWASTSAAALAAKLAKGPAMNGTAGAADVEALEWASLQHSVHHLHHHVHPKQHHHHTHPVPTSHPMHLDPFQQQREKQHHGKQHALHPHPLGDGELNGNGSVPALHGATEEGEGPLSPHLALADGPAGSMNGWGGSSSALHRAAAPYQRGGSAAGMPGSVTPASSGACTPVPGENGSSSSTALKQLRHSSLLVPAPQLAAGATAVVALAAGGVATGWHIACCLLLLSEDRAAIVLPAIALLAAGPGLAGGVVRTYMYPNGITDTAEAMAGGALLTAAALCYSAGAAYKPRATRGGALLGAAAALLLAGLRYFLCSFTPYCLSVQLLLQGR